MRNHLCIIALFVFVIVSCTPDEIGTPFVEGQEVTLTASMANSTSDAKQMPGKQRVSGKDAGATIDLTWNAGDEILVSVGDKSAVFTLSSSENSSLGTFTGKMPADGTEYSVSYPVDYSDDVLTHQTYVENGFGNGLMKMSTKQNGTLDNGFVLSADNAVLGLQLTGSQTLGKIVLTNTATTKTYTLHCDGVALKANEATMFYIVVPVVGWEAGMRVEVLSKDGTVILRKEKEGEITFDATKAMVMPSLEARGPGKRIGVFSVSPTKKVSFSQGNLQYIQSTDTWQFAANQLEYMGYKHYRNGQLADTIEYFGWSGKNSKTPWGISLSTESSDYAGEFLDWGTNTIAGSAPNTWRTLSNDEWLYICQGRKNADQLLGLGKISSIFGLIILPNDWVAPEGITFTPNDNNPNANVYSLQQWTAMEEAGAIFIPPTGYFNHDIDNMRYVGTYGYARNNTLTANGLQIYTLFKPSEIQYSRSAQGNNGNLYYAFPQRLVHDTIVSMPEPEYVDLGLSVKWATFNVGATSPEDYGDYFAWGETETKETYSWATYKWGTSSNLTKYNTTDGKTTLDPEDDAAKVLWGGNWRMPSKEEVDELTQQCNWIWTTHNNVNGYKVTGPNGNSIFLPAAGYKGAGPTYPAGEDGLYWTSTLEKGHFSYLIVLHNDAPPTEASTKGTRCFGFTIRPVYDDKP